MRRLELATAALLLGACTTPGRDTSMRGDATHSGRPELDSRAPSPELRTLDDAEREWAEIEAAAAAKHGTDREATPEELAEQEARRIEQEEERKREDDERLAREERIAVHMSRVTTSHDADLGAEWLNLYVHPLPASVGQMLIYVQRGVSSVIRVNCFVVTKAPLLFPEAASQGVELAASIAHMDTKVSKDFVVTYERIVSVDFPAHLFETRADRSLLIHEGSTKIRTTVPWEAVEALRRVRAERWSE